MTQCLLCLHRLTICTLLSYHLVPLIYVTIPVIPRWVLQEIIKYFTLVHQPHPVGDNDRYSQLRNHTFIELNNDLRVTWSTKSVDLGISDRGRQQSLQEAFRRHSWHSCEWPPPKRHSHTKATIEILTNQRLIRKSEGKAKIL